MQLRIGVKHCNHTFSYSSQLSLSFEVVSQLMRTRVKSKFKVQGAHRRARMLLTIDSCKASGSSALPDRLAFAVQGHVHAARLCPNLISARPQDCQTTRLPGAIKFLCEVACVLID